MESRWTQAEAEDRIERGGARGRTVLITGCSSGFGMAATAAFAARGWRVLATMRAPEGRAVAATLSAMRGVTVLPLDVTDPAARAALADRVAALSPSGLDCLVANAGYGAFGPIEHLTETQIARQIDTNVTGHILTIRALLPALRRARGRIIQISSVLGYVAVPHFAAYVASKHALSGFGEALRYELAPLGVQLCTVEPGRFATDFNAGLDLAEVPATSPYRPGFEAGLKPRRRARPTGGRPEDLGRLLVALAEMRRMPARRAVGADAVAARILRRLLPHPLWDRIMLALQPRARRPRASRPADGA